MITDVAVSLVKLLFKMLDCLCIKCCTDVEVWVIHSFVLTASEKLCRLCKNGLFWLLLLHESTVCPDEELSSSNHKNLKTFDVYLPVMCNKFRKISSKEAAKNKRKQPFNSKRFLLVPAAWDFPSITSCFWFSSILTFTGLPLSLMKHYNCLLHALIYLNGYIHEWLQIIQIIFMPARPIGDKDYSWQTSISNVFMFVNHFMLIWSEMHGSHIFAVIVVV